MKVKCDDCGAVAYNSQEQLIELGGVRSVLISPVRITLTKCPAHRHTMEDAIIEALDGRQGEVLEKNRIGTVEGGKCGDYKF